MDIPKRQQRRHHTERIKDRSVELCRNRHGTTHDLFWGWQQRNILEPTRAEAMKQRQDERDKYAKQIANNITTESRWNNPRKFCNSMSLKEHIACDDAEEQFKDSNLGKFNYRFSKKYW